MNKFLPLVLLTYLLNGINSYSQNLVPNPSFEIFSQCPFDYTQIEFAIDWFKSLNNNVSPFHVEYFNKCGTTGFQVPTNIWGYQAASSGQAYQVLAPLSRAIGVDYRENIYAKLINPLVPGTAYSVSLKVSLADKSKYASNRLGIKFSTTTNFPINNSAHLYAPSPVTDTLNWTTISGCFTADSNYSYIGVGNFFTDLNTNYFINCPTCPINHCGYYMDDISVTTLSIKNSGNTNICIGDSIKLIASGGDTYFWNTGETTPMINKFSKKDTFFVIKTTKDFCSITDTIKITISPPPIANISGKSIICEGDSIILKATGGGTYKWNNGKTNPDIKEIAQSNKFYIVTVSIGSCNDFANFNVVVNPKPIIIEVPDITINKGESVTLTSTESTYYIWNNGSTTRSITLSPLITTTFSVIVQDSNSCTNDDTFIVFVINKEECSSDIESVIPNIFTPNQDGINDDIGLMTYSNGFCIKEFEFIIFNRWGQQLFLTKAFTEHWDGIYKGKQIPPSVLFFYLKLKLITGQQIVKKGTITLIR